MTMLDTTSTVAVSLYALLSTAYKSMQAVYSLPTDVSLASHGLGGFDELPSVDVIVPSFNEDPRTLSECLASIAGQEYGGRLQVYLVDDGSENREALRLVHEAFARDPRFNILLLPQNVGKRKAQDRCDQRSAGDMVLNVDSDTILASDVIRKLVPKNARVAVGRMGQLTGPQPKRQLADPFDDMEYWLACNEERSQQARFGCVMFCSGSCVMYRLVSASLLDQYDAQYFRKQRFGEIDIHLSHAEGSFRTEYRPSAHAATVVPNKLGPYLGQQLRWARSTFRTTLLGAPLPNLNRFLMLDVVGQNLGPLLLDHSVLTGLAQLALTGTAPWLAALMIVAMTIDRCSVVALRARQLRFLGFSLHTFINIFLLLPLKAYALCTLSNIAWLSSLLCWQLESTSTADARTTECSDMRTASKLSPPPSCQANDV
uniref:N-acetylglucosaminyltransferase n=1 Tax=Rhizobium leguminosarum bv. phaseoli TaxID=385 RepID=NODC_RHILP|nr:RecName: Full=N-acetylglucosaminyltransferase; AltName: Full=Nodulation protein C [Rhizobium leguminosarum bv. phaseoli]AAA98211.1 nodulation protein [Plasmid p42d]